MSSFSTLPIPVLADMNHLRLLPPSAVTFVFPNSSEAITVDVARLRENSKLTNDRIESTNFNLHGRLIFITDITSVEFIKYMV